MYPLHGTLVVFLKGTHHPQQLGRGLEIVAGVTPFIQQDNQVVPSLGQDCLRSKDPSRGKDPIGPGGQLAGDSPPIQDGCQKPLLPGLRAGAQINPQFRGKAAGKPGQ